MEKSIPHGGLDLASKDIVNVTLEHILNKYAIDDIGTLSNNVPSVMSLEALKDKITELGKAAKRLLIRIWKATVAFGKEVIKFVKVHVFRQKEKAKLTEAVVKEFTNIAEQISNNKVPVDRTVVVNGVTYILVDKVTKLTKPNSAIYPADLPEVDDVPEPIDDTTFSKTNKKSRIKNILAYFFGAIIATFKVGMQQYVLSISQPPILGGLLGVWGKWIKRAKFIYNIHDFNPDLLYPSLVGRFNLKGKIPVIYGLALLRYFPCEFQNESCKSF